jgi:hypothetical protein
MPTPQREPLRRLSRAERAVLQRIAKSTSERVDQVRRATALLVVARTGVFIHAAREAGLHSGTTVADLVARFNQHGLAAVRIARGRGRRPTYAVSARAQIVATARMSDQGLCLGQIQRERVMQESTDLGLDLFGFNPRTRESEQEIVCVPHVAQPTILRVIQND